MVAPVDQHLFYSLCSEPLEKSDKSEKADTGNEADTEPQNETAWLHWVGQAFLPKGSVSTQYRAWRSHVGFLVSEKKGEEG